MDSAYISALAALAGSVIGGLTSLAASWLSQNAQVRAQQFVEHKNRRQQLYESFIEEASRLYGEALETQEAQISHLVGLYAMVSRMRILSSPAVVEHAEAVAALIVETYAEPNKTIDEVYALIMSDRIDPFRNFSAACRDDLQRAAPV